MKTTLTATAALCVLAGASTSCATGASAQTGARLRLGYLPNVTHAGPVYGVGSGLYQRSLGATRLVPRVFNAGPAEVEALFAGSLDAAYLG
ncbi:MAG: sulfonate ABC transporter substrate-binding protein, partial [Actinomycetota bacterium]|nr:sulfonate ABC transporter substrate-binding protein [Actinomycetota bacterium]